MTPEQIRSSNDVDALYTQLQAAKAADDSQTVRCIEARMRELSGANTRADGRGKRMAVNDQVYRARKARLAQASKAGA